MDGPHSTGPLRLRAGLTAIGLIGLLPWDLGTGTLQRAKITGYEHQSDPEIVAEHLLPFLEDISPSGGRWSSGHPSTTR